MPITTPMISAIQSLKSVLRLKLGWMSSMMPPKTLAQIKTEYNPKRFVLERGKASDAKAMTCTNLSLPWGAGYCWSNGQSIMTVSVIVTMSVRGMSRFLRIGRGVSCKSYKGKYRFGLLSFVSNLKFV